MPSSLSLGVSVPREDLCEQGRSPKCGASVSGRARVQTGRASVSSGDCVCGAEGTVPGAEEEVPTLLPSPSCREGGLWGWEEAAEEPPYFDG